MSSWTFLSTLRAPAPGGTPSSNTSIWGVTPSGTRRRTMSTPTAAELRAVCHPAGLLDRRSGEHWAGRLYMRRISLQLTRHLVGTRITPNQLTYLMIVAGVGAGAVLVLPGLAGPLLAAILIQVYLLLDCVDGEVA